MNANSSALPAWTTEHDHELKRLQVAELFRFAPVMAASSYFGALLTLAVFFDVSERTPGLFWFAFATAVLVYRVVVILTHDRRTRDNPDLWARLTIVGNVLAGIMWGLLGTLLFPVEHGYREIFAVMMITSYVGGSITAYAAVKWAHPALSVPAAFPPAIYLFFFHDGVHAAAGVAALFMVLATMFFAFKEHVRIRERLKLQIQNQSLMARVAAQNVQLRSDNRNLEHRAEVRLLRARAAEEDAALMALHFTQSPLPMLECDGRFRLLKANAAAQAILGQPVDTLLGESLVEHWLTGDARADAEAALSSAVAGNAPRSVPVSFKSADASEVRALWHVTPVQVDGSVTGRVVIVVSDLRVGNEPLQPLRVV